ncbi:MAG: hypothetical protein LWY06_06065 [Firmicutes bacterium]|nr:hypothetical protein [Bacillota bacterium]
MKKEKMLRLLGTIVMIMAMVCIIWGSPVFAQETQQTANENQDAQVTTTDETSAIQPETAVSDSVSDTLVNNESLKDLNNSFDVQLESAKAQEYDLVADNKSVKKNEKPQPQATLHLHYWSEVNTQRLDYSMYFAVISYKDLMFRYDYMDFYDQKQDLNRYWINYGKFPVVKSPDVQITLQPGVHWDSKFNTFYGGYITLNFPKVGLNISQRSYGGEHLDKHYTFADLKLAKTGNVTAYASYYILARGLTSPDAYLGPKVKLGEYFYAWYGFTVCRPGASMFNTSAIIKF